MSEIPTPQIPPYRVTLFYGPETHAIASEKLYCVFNVKKRSWKGGIQVVVNLEREQLTRLKLKLGFAEWLESSLSQVSHDERDEFLERGHDILAQAVCQTKLFLAIQAKLQQENCELDAHYLSAELEAAVGQDEEHLKAKILSELDIMASESN